MTYTTTRPVLFSDRKGTFARKPAGIEVYAWMMRDGTFEIRVPGTLLTQNVRPATLVAV